MASRATSKGSKSTKKKHDLRKDWEDVDKLLHRENLLFVPETMKIKLINRYYNNLLIGYFRIEKTQELIIWKYYRLTFKPNIESYVKECNICLTLNSDKSNGSSISDNMIVSILQ